MAEILTVNGERHQLDDLSLKSLQSSVGGYVELINLPDGRKLLVDEDGRAKLVPYNHLASVIAGQPVLGNVVLCTAVEWAVSNSNNGPGHED